MFRAIPTGNKYMHKQEELRNRTIHLEHLRGIRSSLPTEYLQHQLNNRKKYYVMEDKYTEIERENRILLEKITGIFSKRKPIASSNGRYPKSLNLRNRRDRMQDIEFDNARLLKKLQEKKSDYEVDRMRKEWKQKKAVIKNISNYPITIFGNRKPSTATNTPREIRTIEVEKAFDINKVYELSRVKVIDWYTFHVVIRLDRHGLTITANNSTNKDLKVIEIERGEALDFLRNECGNNLYNVFEKLHYDGNDLIMVSDFQEDPTEKLGIIQYRYSHTPDYTIN